MPKAPIKKKYGFFSRKNCIFLQFPLYNYHPVFVNEAVLKNQRTQLSVLSGPASLLESCPVQRLMGQPRSQGARFASFKPHRSHFGSRYKLGCCGLAGLFAAWFDTSAAHNGVQFHDFTLENSVPQTQVREVLTRQICVFDWCRRHQSKKNTFFFTKKLHFPALSFVQLPPGVC